MSSLPTLIIAGVEVARQTFPVTQAYSRVDGGSTLHRMLNGAGVPQSHWSKIAISISGDGWAPLALAGVDWSSAVEISCIQPRAIHSATVNATLPAARRADLATNVYCRAVVAGELVETPVSVLVNAATATAVAGASSYQFYYYPKLICWSRGPTESLDLSGAVYAWQIEAEEI
jgi:hypothetical protein